VGATLLDIDAAFEAALSALEVPPAGAGPFRFVGRYTGEVTAATEGGVAGVLAGQMLDHGSAALLAPPEEFVERTASAGSGTLLKGQVPRVGRSLWRVYVVLAEPRGPREEMRGAPNTPGMLALTDAVTGALNGLQVPAPAATLNVRVTGTPGATVPVGSARLELGALRYKPSVPTVVLDGTGLATIQAACVTPGQLGNLVNGTALAWSPVPAGADPTATVAGLAVTGAHGLWQAEKVELLDSRPRRIESGVVAVYLMRFTALRPLPRTSAPIRPGVPLEGVVGNVHLMGEAQTPPDPIVRFKSDTT
jgi:hypothetical protein